MPEKTLYVSRPVLNAADIIAWAKDQGFRTTLDPEDMHVTVVFSDTPLEWPDPQAGEVIVRSKLKKETRSVEQFGGGAVVLTFDCQALSDRHAQLLAAGAVSKFPEFRPHITITYDPGNAEAAAIEPYGGRIILGGEVFAEIVDDWADDLVEKSDRFEFRGTFAKMDMKKGQAFGFASVSKVGGDLVIDGEEDQIEPDDLEDAAYQHVIDSRIADEMHDGSDKGTLIESFVFTPQKCAAMQDELRKQGINATIDIPASGWWLGHQITDPNVRRKVASGEYEGFSIGGKAVRVPRAA